jgi:small conductance mechanosensitive channel
MPTDIDEVADATISLGSHLAGAAIVLIVGYVLARLARRFVRHVLERPQVADAIGPTVVQLLIGTAYYLVLAIAVGLALIALGASATVVGTVALILIAIVAIALRESIANFAATVNFLLFQPFKRGELIETMGQFGTVREILLFNTVMLLLDRRLVTLPNSKIQESGIVNYSRLGHIRADITLTVPYDADLDRVREIITDIARRDRRILTHPAFEIAVDALSEDGVRLLVMPMVAPEHFWTVRNHLREQIKERFDVEGIAFAAQRHEVRLAAMPSDAVHPG